MTDTENPLNGKFLLAMPSLKDPFFERSVCYICQNDREKGTIGLVINRPADLREQDLLTEQGLTLENPERFNRFVLEGGPLQKTKGFIIHTQGQRWKATNEIGDALYATTSRDILEAVVDQTLQDDYFMIVGYAAWEPGQLEHELIDKWLVCDANKTLLFNTPLEHRWELGMQNLGVRNMIHFATMEGHA